MVTAPSLERSARAVPVDCASAADAAEIATAASAVTKLHRIPLRKISLLDRVVAYAAHHRGPSPGTARSRREIVVLQGFSTEEGARSVRNSQPTLPIPHGGPLGSGRLPVACPARILSLPHRW